MKSAFLSIALAIGFCAGRPAAAENSPAPAAAADAPAAYHHAPAAALQRFADLRFGIMFHWDPAVLLNSEISWSMSNRAKYESVYPKFDPTNFNANVWAELGDTVGARYMVFVCKHHDGFCMWDTQTTTNSVMHTPFKRDVAGALAAACQRHDLVFGAYLSIMDIHEAGWNHCYAARTDMPGYPEGIPHIADFTEAQTLELLRKYHPQILWYDGGWLEGWRTSTAPLQVAEAIRAVAPDVVITRLGNAVDDYECMEARVGTYRPQPWEMVTSVAYPNYSFNTRLKYKSAAYFVQTLSRVVCGNGNLLLNFVPDAEGGIPEVQLELARAVGGWVKTNGAAIYGTRGGPWYPGAWGGSTRKGDKLFVFLLPDAPATLRLPPCGAKVLGARILGGGAIAVKQDDAGIELSVPADERDPMTTVVELTMDQEVHGMVEASKHLLPVKKKADVVPPPREEIK